jgi:2-polyprenyl-6-hydroxyphenyl methylase/3-demethylubiquinone-9 3-methyltransferase
MRLKKDRSKPSKGTTRTTVNTAEVAQFDRLGAEWWDESGPMAPLHRLNPVRMAYIEEKILALTGRTNLKGLSIADIGCGGGLAAEALAQRGATVTGIDAGAENIAVAAAHAKAQKLKIDYRATTVEALAASGETFDAVTALEIIEHVDDVPLFVESCAQLVRPGGVLIFSTLNRTPKSFALGIVAAEYILRWLKPGTHNWRKFVKPSELSARLRPCGFRPVDVCGLVYRPFSGDFALDARDIDVNYLLTATRG